MFLNNINKLFVHSSWLIVIFSPVVGEKKLKTTQKRGSEGQRGPHPHLIPYAQGQACLLPGSSASFLFCFLGWNQDKANQNLASMSYSFNHPDTSWSAPIYLGILTTLF